MKINTIILGAGIDQIEGLKEAKKLGFYLIGLDGNPNCEGKFILDEFYNVNIKDINQVLDFVKNYNKNKIDAVACFGVDIPEILAKVAEELGVYYQIDYKNAIISKNKFLSKNLLKEKKVNIPPFKGVNSIDNIHKFIKEYGLPIVLKPIDNSASRGVFFIDEGNINNLENYFYTSLKFVQGKNANPSLIVEKFIEGIQLSTESIYIDNKVYTIGIAERNYEFLKKYKPLIIENGGDLPPVNLNIDENLINKINIELKKALNAFDSKNGTIKGDLIIDKNGKVWIIEVAFRLSGGLLSTIEIPLNTGINFIQKYLDIQTKGFCEIKDLKYKIQNFVRLRYVFTEKKGGIIKNINLPKIENTIFKVYAKTGIDISKLHNLYKLPLQKLVGYVIWGKSREEINEKENLIKKQLKVEIQ